MTKAELLAVIQHAESAGNHELARVLRKGWADVLARPGQPEQPKEPASPINGLRYEFNWDDVRLEL
jgi:hypothetical protein